MPQEEHRVSRTVEQGSRETQRDTGRVAREKYFRRTFGSSVRFPPLPPFLVFFLYRVAPSFSHRRVFPFREELMEMQKMMVLKEQLKDKIATIKREIESFEPAKQQLRRMVSTMKAVLLFLPSSSKSIEEKRGNCCPIYRHFGSIIVTTDFVYLYEDFKIDPSTRSRPLHRSNNSSYVQIIFFRINREIGSATNLFRKIYVWPRTLFLLIPNRVSQSIQHVLFFSRCKLIAREKYRFSPFLETVRFSIFYISFGPKEKKKRKERKKGTIAKIGISKFRFRIRIINRTRFAKNDL